MRRPCLPHAGPGTEAIRPGGSARTGTPYLAGGGSGITGAGARFAGREHSVHVTPARGERSRLFDRAAGILGLPAPFRRYRAGEAAR